jgi:hypothetical protein
VATFVHNRPAGNRIEKKTGDALQSAFERQVLHGLMAEWQNALWLLPATLRQSIRRPLFAIRSMPHRLGCWDPAKREITLSRELVAGHAWDDVRDVLLHEMAHQVAHEGLAARAETDHGHGFKKACGLLRANPRASGAYPTLHQRLQQGDPLDANDRMVIKIHKLMALAESSNANEAHAAMRKAHELIARHNIDLIRHGQHQSYISIFLGRPRLRHFRESYHLAHLLQDYYFVQGVWTQAWVLEKARMGRVLEISGSIQNVQIAEYLYGCVRRYIDTAWADYRRGKSLNRYRQSDFAVGVIEGFRSTLRKASASTVKGNDTGLPMRVDDQALSRYLTRRYPHLRSFSRKGPAHDGQVLADGTECGKKLVVAKGVRHQAGYTEQLLDYHGKGHP